MRRDLNLMRSILLEIESIEDGRLIEASQFKCLGQPSHCLHFRIYQIALIDDLGLAIVSPREDGSFGVRRLTSKGHDVVDSIRDDKEWSLLSDRYRRMSFSQ